MKKILWFNIKEPYEKLIDKILKAKEEKRKIEITGSYLKSIGGKQVDKYAKWVEDNKEWLEDKFNTETELQRLQKKIPFGCSMELINFENETYFMFDFS